MGIREDLEAGQAEVSNYIGLGAATRVLATHERVTLNDAACWLLIKKFYEKLLAFEVNEMTLQIRPLYGRSAECAEQDLVEAASSHPCDDSGVDYDEVYWRKDELFECLVSAGIDLAEDALDSESSDDPMDFDDPETEHDDAVDTEAHQEATVQLQKELQLAQAQIKHLKTLIPPRLDARLMPAVIATQQQFWVGWKAGAPRPKSAEEILPWIKEQFPHLRDEDAKAVDRVACPIDRNPASKSSRYRVSLPSR